MQHDTENAPSLPDKTRRGMWRLLATRYAARRAQHRSIPWLGYTLSIVNIVALAFFVLDAPLGKTARDLPAALVAFAGDITNVGQMLRMLGAIVVIFVVGVLLARRLADLRRRYRVAYFARMAAYLLISVLSASAVVHVLKTAIGSKASLPPTPPRSVRSASPWPFCFQGSGWSSSGLRCGSGRRGSFSACTIRATWRRGWPLAPGSPLRRR